MDKTMVQNALTTHTFGSSKIRVVSIKDAPWFVGADVLHALYGRTAGFGHIYDPLNPDERTRVKRVHLGALSPGKDMTLVSESGLYKLVMRSDKPQARKFQDWVTQEVLPSIRRTGSYQHTVKLPTGERVVIHQNIGTTKREQGERLITQGRRSHLEGPWWGNALLPGAPEDPPSRPLVSSRSSHGPSASHGTPHGLPLRWFHVPSSCSGPMWSR